MTTVEALQSIRIPYDYLQEHREPLNSYHEAYAYLKAGLDAYWEELGDEQGRISLRMALSSLGAWTVKALVDLCD